MLPVVWWNADTIVVLRTSDSKRDKRFASIWVGSIPATGDSGMAYRNPSFSLRIKLENPRKAGDKQPFDKSLAHPTGITLTQVPAVRVSLHSARPSLTNWAQIDLANRDILIDEITSVLNEALRKTTTKTGATVWESCQGTAPLGGWWMASTLSGFLKRSEAVLVARDSMACQALVVMLKNSQQPRDEDGPLQLFPGISAENDSYWVPDGWEKATFTIGTATFDPEVNVMLDFTEESAKEPFTVDERLAYGIVDSLTLEEIPLPERKVSAYSMDCHDWALTTITASGTKTHDRRHQILFCDRRPWKRPDGMVFDMHERTIYVIEVASTADSEGSLRNRYVKNSEIRTYCGGTPAGLHPLQSRTKKKNPGDWFDGQYKRISMETVTLGWNDKVSAR
jgi:hypothetical protein